MNNFDIEKIYNKYHLTEEEKREIDIIIKDIYSHTEFIKRCEKPFYHHDRVTLGQHIIEDAIMTYILSRKYKNKNNYDISIALKIAMFHDLYTEPWQNNGYNTKFLNKHGFRHPLEAVINVINWYPQYFKNERESRKIIDGILHHMYPLPVDRFNDTNNNAELINYDLIENLTDEQKRILYLSTSRGKIGLVSLSKSKYLEGRVMSRADKKVSLGNYKGSKVGSIISLLNGKNKHLK